MAAKFFFKFGNTYAGLIKKNIFPH